MSKKHRDTRQRPETLASLLLPVFEGRLEESLGSRLRELRRQQGLSLRSLAEKSGLSANTLSLIENGKTSPSVATLNQIALALNVPITGFFEVDTRRDPVIYMKRGSRTATPFAYGTIEELGPGVTSEGVQPFLISFQPMTASGPQPLTHDGMEFIYCLSGKIIYNVIGQEYLMEPGDSLVFSSQMPHTWHNPGLETAQALIVLSSLEDRHTTYRPSMPQSRFPV
jgi:transcriptional regulator with XRE-family HTH domain